MESRREGKSGPRTMLGPARTGLLATGGPRPGALSPELSDRGKGVQTQPRPRLCHSIQSQGSWMSQREPKGAVRRLLRRKQVDLSSTEHP
ncbi:hypothetical protein PGIGA_G00188680, partial [Pangasianodon gigas]|nr:hypothetical protein [Pangasianodon gigas]